MNKLLDKQMDKLINDSWSKYASGVVIPMMSIPKIFKEIKEELLKDKPIEACVLEAVERHRVN